METFTNSPLLTASNFSSLVSILQYFSNFASLNIFSVKKIRKLIKKFLLFSSKDLENDNQTDLQSKQSASTQSSSNPLLLCPLCQSQFTQRANLQQHIIDTHNVSKEGVQRLMTIVDSAKENNVQTLKSNNGGNSASLSPLIHKSSNQQQASQLNNSLNSNHSELDSSMDYDESAIESEQVLKANNNIDRHLHKFRCAQCPLSFRTADKLALHSQYHKIRAASQCVLCGKTTRSIESMQKHMEVFHKEMTEQELDTYRLSLVNNPLLLSLKNGCQGVLDPATTELLKRESNRDLEQFENGTRQIKDSLDDEDDLIENSPMRSELVNDSNNNDSLLEDEDRELVRDELNQSSDEHQLGTGEEYLNSQNVAEDSYNDPTRKYKCHRCRVAYTRQTYLSAHNKTLYHRKGEKLTYPMEKFLDPNRPFKCELCKESFTQKNILMTHYNSVSHLQRQNQAMKELNNQSNQTALNDQVNSETGDEQPFKCNVCKLGFSSSSQLDNHTQTLQHQNRISKLPQLAISGQIDLNKPLVERINSNSTNADKLESDQPNFSLISEQLHLLQQLTAQQNQLNNQMNNQSNFRCSQCSSTFSNQDQLNQHQQICFLLSAMNGNNVNSNSVNSSQNSNSNAQNSANKSSNTPPAISQQQIELLQQQLLESGNKFYNAQACKSGKPPVYKHLLETWGFEIVQQFNEHHQRGKIAINDELQQQLQVENESAEQLESSDECGEPQSKEPISSEELEENNQNQVEAEGKSNEEILSGEEKAVEYEATAEQQSGDERETDPDEPISKVTLKLILDQEQEDQDEKKENDPNTTNNTEAKCSKCETCLKEFSSIWVLKAHKEEVHNDVVKMEKVQDFAEIYRKEFERKNSIVVKSVVLENEPNCNQLNSPMDGASRNAQQRSTPNPTSSTSAEGSASPALAEQQLQQQQQTSEVLSASEKIEKVSTRTSTSRLEQTNELNNSNNSSIHNKNTSGLSNNSGSSSNLNNEANSLASSLLSNSNPLAGANPLNPLLAGNPLLANNPLLSQVASLMANQQQSTANNNVNDQMNQMAQQLQVNQLLMGLSLAGAMNNGGGNANQQQQQANVQQSQQQAAIMALINQGLLPPQMIPLLMANADPMMSLLAANPMLAAAAASQQSNSLAGLLSSMSPEALNPMLAAGLLPGVLNNLSAVNQKSPNPIVPNVPALPNAILNASSNPPAASSNANLLHNNSQTLQAQQAAQTAAAAAAAAAAQSGKRARTRISDDQLKILRQYFDINNSPTEEALQVSIFYFRC